VEDVGISAGTESPPPTAAPRRLEDSTKRSSQSRSASNNPASRHDPYPPRRSDLSWHCIRNAELGGR